MSSLNHAIFLALNGPADPSRPVLWLAILCAKYLFLLAPLHMALVWLGGTARMRAVALAGLVALVAALIGSGILGAIMYTPRPQEIGLGHTLIEHRASAAFPSNHAIVCFVWAATLALHGRRSLTIAFGAIGLLVAWSRIYLGIHFPLDIVGALIIASGVAGAAIWAMTHHGERLLALSDAIHRQLAGASWSRLAAG